MLSAARALVRIENTTVSDDADTIVSEFRQRFHETRLFWDPFARDKFANYLFKVHGERPGGVDHEEAHRQIEEASLFIEAAHACYDRLQERGA
jgi:sulfite reductase (ferredoxin)